MVLGITPNTKFVYSLNDSTLSLFLFLIKQLQFNLF